MKKKIATVLSMFVITGVLATGCGPAQRPVPETDPARRPVPQEQRIEEPARRTVPEQRPLDPNAPMEDRENMQVPDRDQQNRGGGTPPTPGGGA